MTLPSFGHLLTLADGDGIFEHADHAVPRPEHGSCVDDVARLLVVCVREGERDQAVRDLRLGALRYLTRAQDVTGRVRNRPGRRRLRRAPHGVEDCWGRSLWAFGEAARSAPDERERSTATSYFDRGATQRSPHRRAMAFAALGAADVVAHDERSRSARDLLADAIDVVLAPEPAPGDAAGGAAEHAGEWPWPEARLSYADAVLADALVAAGHALERPGVVERGLELLAWLLERQVLDGHLSPTPVGGAGPGDRAPGFDQQPIEPATLADACHRAQVVTGDPAWRRGVDLAIGWFAGDNDVGAVMWDPRTHGGYDGLTPTGPNLNQGAESTLALISTMQRVERDPEPIRGPLSARR